MTTPIANVDNTTLNNLTPNLDTGDVADPALRKAAFQYIYTEMQTIITAYNAFIAAGGVATGNLADLSVTTAKLADLAVTTGKIPDLAIVTAKINDLAVTAAKIAVGTITSTQIADLSIATGDLADALITTAKLADLNVTTGKLADASVTLAKMAAASVGTSQLVDGSVTNAKIASGVITADKFVAGALNNDTQNGLLITALQADTTSRAINVKYPPASLMAAKGDGVTDDTAAIQAIINYAVVNKNARVYFPSGTYITSKPLYVWGAYNNENIQIYLIGDAYNTTFIKKTSHGTLNDGSPNAAIDAILILYNYDMSTHDTGGQMINDITLNGTVGTSDYVQYGVYSGANVCYTKYENIQIINCKRGLYFNANFFQNQIRNVVMYITEYGVYIGATGTSNWLEKMLIVGATITAYKLNGIYSAGASLVAQNTSGIVYDIAFGDWAFDGLGEESSTGSVILQATNATVHVSGLSFLGTIGSGSTILKAGNNSVIIIDGGTIGNSNASAGKLYETLVNAKLELNGVLVTDTYATYASSGGATSNVTIKGNYNTGINLFQGIKRPYIGVNRRPKKLDYFNTVPKFNAKAIFLSCKDSPLVDADGTNLQFDAHGNQGDIFLVDDPAKNTALGWVIISDTANVNGALNNCNFAKIPLWGGSGVTGSRPTWAQIGLNYFDTTLNKPVWCKTAAVYEVDTVTVTGAATSSGNVSVTLNGVATNIAVVSGDSANTIASKIAATNFANYTTSVVGAVVTFTSTLGGTRSAPSYSAGTTGATATAAVSTAGVNPVWVDATGTTV